MRRFFYSLFKTYLAIGVVYGLWAFVFLSFRECGFFGANCLPVGTRTFSVAVYAITIAATRGVLWLPNLLIAIGQGAFLDWLLFRDVPPLDVLLNSN